MQQQSDPMCSQLPPQRLNGGWFTGEPFRKGAGWATVPVIPEAGHMTSDTLLSANPPPGATTQSVGYPRAGNNCQTMPNVMHLESPNNTIACTGSAAAAAEHQPDARDRFSRYAYC